MQIIIGGRQYEILSNIQSPDVLWVQARNPEDLAALFPGMEAKPGPSGEFPFRAKLPRVKVANELARRVAGLVPGGVPTLYGQDPVHG